MSGSPEEITWNQYFQVLFKDEENLFQNHICIYNNANYFI